MFFVRARFPKLLSRVGRVPRCGCGPKLADVFVSPASIHLEYAKVHMRPDVIIGAQNVFNRKVRCHARACCGGGVVLLARRCSKRVLRRQLWQGLAYDFPSPRSASQVSTLSSPSRALVRTRAS